MGCVRVVAVKVVRRSQNQNALKTADRITYELAKGFEGKNGIKDGP